MSRNCCSTSRKRTAVRVSWPSSTSATAWKARHLAFCREAAGRTQTPTADAGSAWKQGLCLGLHCIQSCAGLTAVALALGVMDLRVMAVMTTAITVERLAPNRMRVARAIGVVGVAVGLVAIARAARPG